MLSVPVDKIQCLPFYLPPHCAHRILGQRIGSHKSTLDISQCLPIIWPRVFHLAGFLYFFFKPEGYHLYIHLTKASVRNWYSPCVGLHEWASGRDYRFTERKWSWWELLFIFTIEEKSWLKWISVRANRFSLWYCMSFRLFSCEMNSSYPKLRTKYGSNWYWIPCPVRLASCHLYETCCDWG